MDEWKGILMAESLDDPTIINQCSVDRALITKPFEWAPSKGSEENHRQMASLSRVLR